MVSWTTVITGLVSGVIGVVGTSLGAWLTGRTQTANLQLSIDAERERARIADKRQTYARCLASLTDVVVATAKLDEYGADVGPEERRSLVFASHDSLAPMFVAMNEMRLVAPESLGKLVDNIMREVTHWSGQVELGVESEFEFAPLREQLYQAMRADLGGQQLPAPAGHE
jgi:hypothetical protein